MAGEEWPRPQALTRQAESAITEPVAGRYVLICNMAGHHQAGMRAPFTVRLSLWPTRVVVQSLWHRVALEVPTGRVLIPLRTGSFDPDGGALDLECFPKAIRVGGKR
jgi:hypothetical protein